MGKDALFASLTQHEAALRAFITQYAADIAALAERLAHGFAQGKTLLICGNGGSACDAMHIAGEFVGRFQGERRALPAIALSADSGILTAVGNDYGFARVFARQVEAYGQPGAVLVALSTSGASANVLEALAAARNRGMYTVLMTGEKGRDRAAEADALWVVPSLVTARIQEAHLFALHALAEQVDALLAAQPNLSGEG